MLGKFNTGYKLFWLAGIALIIDYVLGYHALKVAYWILIFQGRDII